MNAATPVHQSRSRHVIARALTAAPFIIAAVCLALLAWRPTRLITVNLTDENGPVELGTFLLLLIAAGQAWVLTYRLRRAGQRRIWRGFYLVFGLLLFLTAMEEISWGQWFFRFRTPAA